VDEDGEMVYTGSFSGDNPGGRDWLLDGARESKEDLVDPALLAKFAAKDFTPREQREFIDESGEARNLGKLDLRDTHYSDPREDDPELALW
jgi:hypothetical protein